MTRVDEYRQQLQRHKNWEPFLRKSSGLPGPRGNLELAAAVALEATPAQIEAFLSLSPAQAPENSPGVFVLFCGVLALGRLIAAGNPAMLKRLRGYASDHRWRIREAVAMAMQTVGDADTSLLLREISHWSTGNWYEKRAAAAAIAEPRLLRSKSTIVEALRILDGITESMTGAGDRKSDSFKVLRQAMGYCWSVVIAAQPAAGKPYFEKWLKTTDHDVLWLLRENLKKRRLIKVDPIWVKNALTRLGA